MPEVPGSGLRYKGGLLMNRLLMLGTAALLAIILALPAVAVARKEITMSMTDRPVVFDHDRHMSLDCTTCHTVTPSHFPLLTVYVSKSCQICHHLVDGDQPSHENCSSCHKDTSPQSRRGGESYFAIAHQRDTQPGIVSCLSCHYEVAQLRPEMKNALTACSGSSCHP